MLTDRFDDVVELNGKRIELNMAFDIVLRSFELWEDDHLHEQDKINTFVEMFAGSEIITELDEYEKMVFVNTVIEKFILEEGQEEAHPQKKTHDLKQDAEYIYASFLFDYNIDLFEKHGKLHWKKFKALLNNLSEDSKFMKVVGYRVAKIPAPTKYNKEQRDHLIAMKRLYSLENRESIEDIDAKFDQLASVLRPSGGEGNG